MRVGKCRLEPSYETAFMVMIVVMTVVVMSLISVIVRMVVVSGLVR
jgi:hypothetical protein